MKKKILILNFYPMFIPPKSGGELRIYNIYKNLARYYHITFVGFTFPIPDIRFQEINQIENLAEIRIPKSRIHDFLHFLFNRIGGLKECSGVVVSLASIFNKTFKQIFDNFAQEADIVIFSQPFLFRKFKKEGQIYIYEAQNVEAILQEKMFGNSIVGKILSKYVKRLEKNVCDYCDLIFAVSELDKEKFNEFYGTPKNKIRISPNGVDTKNVMYIETEVKKFSKDRYFPERNVILFIGSFHPPNIDSLKCIVKDIAPFYQNDIFLIAGKICDYFTMIGMELEEDLETSIKFVSDDSLLHGWYPLESWDGIYVRWTKKRFSIILKEGSINGLKLKIFCKEKNKCKVYIDGKNNKEFDFINGDQTINIDLNEENNDKSIFTFELRDTFESGDRELGIVIKEISYIKNWKTKKIDLEKEPMQIYSLSKIPNVKTFGVVSEEIKNELFKISNIALNPMKYGSGTNIKMLDYMASGIPVITTPEGARGLEIENGKNAIICDLEDFNKNIEVLYHDNELYEKIKSNARYLVEKKYSWEKIALNYHKDLEKSG